MIDISTKVYGKKKKKKEKKNKKKKKKKKKRSNYDENYQVDIYSYFDNIFSWTIVFI